MKIEIDVDELIAIKKPFMQGGNLRIVLPKKIEREYLKKKDEKGNMEDNELKEEYCFYKTSKGLLLLWYDKAVSDSDLPPPGGPIRGSKFDLEEFKDHLEELDQKIDI